MKYSKAFQVFILSIALIFINCTARKNASSSEKTMLQKIYVEEIDSTNVITKAKELEVIVRGNLPSPAYSFDGFDVQIRGTVIEITPLAKYDTDKIAAQVLVPFEEVCSIKNLKPGIYEVKVNGRARSVKVKKTIQIKE